MKQKIILPSWLGALLLTGQISLLGQFAGSRDFTFDPGAGIPIRKTHAPRSVTSQADGKVLIGGGFTTINGIRRDGLSRLNSDGSVDLSFNPALTNGAFGVGEGTVVIGSTHIQSDNKVIVIGSFTAANGTPVNQIARLHSDGSIDSSFQASVSPRGFGAGSAIDSIALQSDDKILIGGGFFNVGGKARDGIARLHSDGSLDLSFDPVRLTRNTFPSSAVVFGIAVQPDGKVLIGGGFDQLDGKARNGIARLNADGSLDLSFGTLDLGFDAKFGRGGVREVVLQADGKVIIAGWFTQANGVPRNGIARLNADGTLDPSFDPKLASDTISSIVMPPDGMIIIAGTFRNVNGIQRNGLARLNRNGTLDTTFYPKPTGAEVSSVALQMDGKLIIAGDFQNVDGNARSSIARLRADGTVDTAFNPGFGAMIDRFFGFLPDPKLVPQKDGNLLLAGTFDIETSPRFHEARGGITRLMANGVLDPSFSPGEGIVLVERAPFTGEIFATAVQPDGKILIGGNFYTVRDIARNGIARLNPDGEVDTKFNPGQGIDSEGSINAIALQADGKVLISGSFSAVGGIPRKGVARLLGDGSLDISFNPGSGASAGGSRSMVFTLQIQADGKVLIGGDFNTVNDLPRNGVARLNRDGMLDPDFQNSSLLWVGDIQDIKSLATELKQQSGSVSQFLWTQLSNAGRQQVTAYTGANVGADALQTTLVGELNRVIQGSSIYQLQRFSGVTLSTETQALLGTQGLAGERLARLNRLLLEDAYPLEFAESWLKGAHNGVADATVYAVAVQTDGKVVIGGNFQHVNGASRSSIARLNADGSVDTTFNPGKGMGLDEGRRLGRGKNPPQVSSIVLQPAGDIIVAGEFEKVDGNPSYHIARLWHDGRLDPEFSVDGSVFRRWVDSIALQHDGKLLISGGYWDLSLGFRERVTIARVYAGQTLTPSPPVGGFTQELLIAVGGTLTLEVPFQSRTPLKYQWKINGTPIRGAVNPKLVMTSLAVTQSGTYFVEASNAFGSFAVDAAVVTVVLPPSNDRFSNRSVISGLTNTVTGWNVGATKETGEPNHAENPGGHSVWWTWTATTNGNVSLDAAGSFFDVALAVYTGTSLLNLTLVADTGSISGVSVASLTFAAQSGTVFQIAVDGRNTATGSILLNIRQEPHRPPQITTQPQNQTIIAGTSVTFSVAVIGTTPLTYQWRKDEVRIPGATYASYTIANVQASHGGSYSVLINNLAGEMRSTNVALVVTILAPSITTQPQSQTVTAGHDVTLTVAATGTAPFSYQWQRGGTSIPGATNANYTIRNVQIEHSDIYSVAVANLSGSATSSNAVLRVTALYTFITLAGVAGSVGSADGTGQAARFDAPNSITADISGNVYVADSSSHTIRKATSDGKVSTFAGIAGKYGGVDGPAGSATLWYPSGVAVDVAGSLYVADRGSFTVRRITPGGFVSTLAGALSESGSTDGFANKARFSGPSGVAVDSASNVYVADTWNHTIRKITPDGVVSTLAGVAGSAGSADGTASIARFNNPHGMAVDATGNIYVADTFNSTIRKITTQGVVTTLAGLAGTVGSTDGVGSTARLNKPTGLAVDTAGNVYVADTINSTIRKITPAGVVTTLAGLAGINGTADGTAQVAKFNKPGSVTIDSLGNIYIADTANSTLRKGTLPFGSAIRPTLAAHIQRGSLVLSWPAISGGFLLESTASLLNPNWTTVSLLPVTIADQYVITNATIDGTVFFRLRKP